MASPSLTLHALLRPWLDTLVNMRIRPVKHTPITTLLPTVSIAWMCPRHHRARSFEALELFVLLAKADISAWHCFIVELQAASAPWFAYQWASLVLEPEQQPHVAGVDLVCTQLSDALVLTAYLSGPQDSDDVPHKDYTRVRTVLEQKLQDKSVPVQLRIKPGRPWRANMLDALPAIAELGALQSKLQLNGVAAGHAHGCRLAARSCRVVAMHNDIAEFTRVDDAYLDAMMAIHSHSIQVADLPPLELVRTPRNTARVVTALSTLLGTGQGGCISRVVMARLDQSMVAPGLLSAVAFSQSVREVAASFQLAAETAALPQRRAVHWLAFALFSPHASHAVVKTRINCDALTSVHVQWMEELLLADDPLQLLFQEQASDVAQYTETQIATSKVFLEDVTSGGDVEQVVMGTQFESLRVIGRGHGCWSVFLPGWGCAWVLDSDATVSARTSLQCAALLATVRPLRQLELWGFREENKDAVLQLLQLIGHSVQALELLDRDGSLDTWCPGVFQSCANLEDLHLWEASSDDLLAFAESFASGHCRRLKRLSVGVEMLTEEAFRELTTLLYILADLSHPLAQQLQVFEFDVFCVTDGHDILDSNVLAEALQVLESNRSLSFFKLHLPLATSTPETTPRIKAAFEKHHDVLLLTPREPMATRNKAAFLSVVWGHNGDHSPPITGMESLDPSLLTAIFEFVPDRRRRLVDVAMPRAAHDADG